jgi:uncharacterized protein (DUF1810 family)
MLSGPTALAKRAGQRSRMTAMTYDLERFVRAQEPVYEDVVRELRDGRKTSHWMWFIFPQVAPPGSTERSSFYSITTLGEARAYLAHPVLGPRLRECAGLVLAARDRAIDEIFDVPVDVRKLQSSMTLFHRADPEDPVFAAVLDTYFDGVADARTDQHLAAIEE